MASPMPHWDMDWYKYVFQLIPNGYLLGAALVALTLYYWPIWKRHKYPPGPMPLPFIGNTLLLFKPGNFMQDFAGLGLVNEDDGKWQKLRRQLLAVFKEHGIGKTGMEECITAELGFLIDELGRKVSDPFDIQDLLTQSVSNIIAKVVFGSRFDYTAEQLKNLQLEDFAYVCDYLEWAPIMEKLPGDLIGFHVAKRKADAALNFIEQQVEHHKNSLDPENLRDFIDAFLVKMKEDGDYDTFTEKNLLAVVMELFFAGTDTTSTNLYWALLYLVKYPEMQERIHEEIMERIGSRAARYTDRNSMPYTMSFIAEALRICIAFGSLSHYSTRDVIVRGHKIPQGTELYGNLWAACHDESVFPDAKTFNADRFIDKDGAFIKSDSKSLMPFSVGRRACPGEPLARMEMFLFLVAILQKFEVHSGQEAELSETRHRRFLLKPASYLIRLTLRTQ